MINYDAGRSLYGKNKKLRKLIPEIREKFFKLSHMWAKNKQFFRYTALCCQASYFIYYIFRPSNRKLASQQGIWVFGGSSHWNRNDADSEVW